MKRSSILSGFGFFLVAAAFLLTVIDFCSFDRSFFVKEYAANNTVQATGLTEEGLEAATDVLLDYLKDKRDNIDLQAEVNGNMREVFDAREKAHMIDVKRLYRSALTVRTVLLAAGIICVAAAVYMAGKDRLTVVSSGFLYGVLFLGAVVAALLLYALVDFNNFWTNFHLTFFDNDLWLLDPNTEIMINMVPETFFYHLVVRIILMFLIPVIVLAVALRFISRRRAA